MHNIVITLMNADSLRLTMSLAVPFRSTPYENIARAEAEVRVNADASHSKYGPWFAHDSNFTN